TGELALVEVLGGEEVDVDSELLQEFGDRVLGTANVADREPLGEAQVEDRQPCLGGLHEVIRADVGRLEEGEGLRRSVGRGGKGGSGSRMRGGSSPAKMASSTDGRCQ